MIVVVIVVVPMIVVVIVVVPMVVVVIVPMIVVFSYETDAEDSGDDRGDEADDGSDNGNDGSEKGVGDQDRIRTCLRRSYKEGHAGRTGRPLIAHFGHYGYD